MAREWAKDDIRINAVAPWMIWIPLVQPVILNYYILSRRKKILGVLSLSCRSRAPDGWDIQSETILTLSAHIQKFGLSRYILYSIEYEFVVIRFISDLNG